VDLSFSQVCGGGRISLSLLPFFLPFPFPLSFPFSLFRFFFSLPFPLEVGPLESSYGVCWSDVSFSIWVWGRASIEIDEIEFGAF